MLDTNFTLMALLLQQQTHILFQLKSLLPSEKKIFIKFQYFDGLSESKVSPINLDKSFLKHINKKQASFKYDTIIKKLLKISIVAVSDNFSTTLN